MCNITKEEMQKLIGKAPLEKQDKDFLTKLFNDCGETTDFYEKFNELLIKELKNKELVYAGVIGKFDNEEKNIKNSYLEKKDQAEKELSLKLNDIKSFQLKEGNIIMDHYYQQLDGIKEDYENGIKKLATQLLMSLLQN
jgi:hypothetical protein